MELTSVTNDHVKNQTLTVPSSVEPIASDLQTETLKPKQTDIAVVHDAPVEKTSPVPGDSLSSSPKNVQNKSEENTVKEEASSNIAEIFDKLNLGKDSPENLKNKKNNFLLQNLAPYWDSKNWLSENIKLNYPHWFNIGTVGLHALGGILPSIPLVPKNLSLAVRNVAIKFSQYAVPVSKLHNFFEALQGKRLYEAVARILPNVFLPFLPFHNFQLAYGLGAGINVVHEHIKSRVGELRKEDGFAVNNKKIQDGFVHAVKDLFYGKGHVDKNERIKLGLTLGGGAAMLLGAIPTLIFDRQGLNDGFARFFGSIRSLGGLLGDLSITIFPSHRDPELKKREPLIGKLYMVPTFMDFAQRWMNQGEEANEIFNHLKTTLNTIAELLWTNFSAIENHKAKNAELEKEMSKKLHEAKLNGDPQIVKLAVES